jgi:hypothetical protein
VFELISGLVQFLADALAQNDASLVQEHVTLHRFEPEFTKPVTFALSPHAETSLQQQPAQLGQTSLLIRARKSRNKICTNTSLYLVTGDGHLVHAVVDATENGQHGVEGRLEIVIVTADVVGGAYRTLAVLHQILEQELVLGDPLNGFEQIGTEW